VRDGAAMAPRARGAAVTRSERLAVDPTACRAHGLCAEMLPDLIRLDEWGYPLLPADPIPRGRRRAVRGAVHACPALALRLAVVRPEPGRGQDCSSADTI
jgi:ferredoxin